MGVRTEFLAAFGILLFSAAAAQVTEITITPEILGVDEAILFVQSSAEKDVPAVGLTTVTVSLKTNAPVTGYTFFFSSTEVPLVTDVELLSISGVANTFGGAVIAGTGISVGGSQAASFFAPGPPLPVSFGPTCTDLADCVASDFVEFAEFVVTTPSTMEVFLFGPGGDDENFPIFDVPVDFAAPVEMTSDPHFKGLRGQEYDFTGEPGKVYAIISDRGLAINAFFSKGYTTGITANAESMTVSSMYEKGTWVWAMGIIVFDHAITISCETSQLASGLCPAVNRNDFCFMGGSVEVDGNEIVRLGDLVVDEATQLNINLYNSKSFARLSINSPILEAKIDYVPAPASWEVPAGEASTYAHLNMQIKKILLSEMAHGVLGQTSRSDKANLEASDVNGTGLLDGQPSDYEVSDILSTDFTFSVFQN